MNRQSVQERQLTGRHVLMMMLIFFGLIIVANSIFITYAIRSFPGQSVKKSYFQGLHYNDTLAKRRVQQALGWKIELSRAERIAEDGIVELYVLSRSDIPLAELKIAGTMERPTNQAYDREVNFLAAGDGRYVATIPRIEAGVWKLALQATDQQNALLDFEVRLILP